MLVTVWKEVPLTFLRFRQYLKCVFVQLPCDVCEVRLSAGCGQVLLYYGENRLDHPIDYRLYSLSNQETRNHFTYNFIIYYGDNPACIDIVTHSQRAI